MTLFISHLVKTKDTHEPPKILLRNQVLESKPCGTQVIRVWSSINEW